MITTILGEYTNCKMPDVTQKKKAKNKEKKAQTCKCMDTSAGIQNRVTLWRTIDIGRETIQETTRIFKVGGSLKPKC